MRHIMIIDDDLIMRSMIAEYFTAGDDYVSMVENYDDAIRLLPQNEWDIIYLDHDLGMGRTGHDIAKWIIAHPAMRIKKVIITSNNCVGAGNIFNELAGSGIYLEIFPKMNMCLG